MRAETLSGCAGGRRPGDTCPLNRLDEAEQSEAGRLLRRALDLRAASRMGIQITLDHVAADEFQAMAILDEEGEKWEREQQRK